MIITREEERHKAAKEFAFSDKTETQDFYNVMNDFYYGAKWAIERACEWFNNMDIDTFKDLECDGNYYFSYGEFIERFKEAMGYENS